MSFIELFWVLLRYRVAIMLILFLLIGCSFNGKVDEHSIELVVASAALMFSYISATSVNDIADREIDSINHSGKPGRPLITGRASESQMWMIFTTSSVISLVLAAFIGVLAFYILVISIVINITYSLRPLRVSYRTYLAPFYLAIAYVFLPFILGVTINNRGLPAAGYVLICSLYLLFICRIVLKDFRDRKGDSKFGKPTLLLKFGKKITCIVSYAALLLGSLLMIKAMKWQPLMVVTVSIYFCLISYCLLKLLNAPLGKLEQFYIGLGAKMGNGLLLSLLAYLILLSSNASESTETAGILFVSSLFIINFFVIIKNPELVIVGYKG